LFIWLGCLTLLGLSILLISFLIAFANQGKNLDDQIRPEQISILIPFRNEADLLSQIIYLSDQISSTGIQVFWIDDFSDRISDEVLNELERNDSLNLISRTTGNQGKKEAIFYGLQQLNSEWVLLMDADSRPDLACLTRGELIVKKSWRMILLPVVPIYCKGVIRKFFDLEFLVLQLVTHASAAFGRPLLANGASLMVKREDYIKSQSHRSDFHIPSGDDVFALFAFQSKYGRASIGSGAKVLLPWKIAFPSSFVSLWKQRVRWVSKSTSVPNFWYMVVSILVLLSNISFAVLLASVFTSAGNNLIRWSIAAYFIIAVLFIFRSVLYSKRLDLVPYIVPAILVYPFYLSALLFASLVSKPKWK